MQSESWVIHTKLKVSVLLLENYEPPTFACALNEVLALLVGDGLSNVPTIVVPFVVAATRIKMENRISVAVDNTSVYGLQVAGRAEWPMYCQAVSYYNCKNQTQVAKKPALDC
ncbi:hypothetical protein HAX54_015063 [Datura stramonium]|uniref:DUF7894 domain-containing protein n=1 Tax=Datura stramonium TaxID=4076 RepID=A0ABS8TQZ9_DATST|nr:hypothetical protein [Datura stramonium]